MVEESEQNLRGTSMKLWDVIKTTFVGGVFVVLGFGLTFGLVGLMVHFPIIAKIVTVVIITSLFLSVSFFFGSMIKFGLFESLIMFGRELRKKQKEFER